MSGTAQRPRLAAAVASVLLLTSLVLDGTWLTGTGPSAVAPILASAVLTTAFLLIATGARLTVMVTVPPQRRLAGTLRRKAWRAAFLRVTDPDARGRTRPRAPAVA